MIWYAKSGGQLRVGDRLVVYDMPFQARISGIVADEATGRVKINLDWGQYGKSHVYLHDEGSVWQKHADPN